MDDETVHVRVANSADAAQIAEVHMSSRAATMPYLPPQVRTHDQVAQWVAEVLLRDCRLWVAVRGREILGYAVLEKSVLAHLYLRPEVRRRGIGTMLLDQAKQHSPQGFTLHVFQANTTAMAFYRRHGFTVTESTDGARNMEQLPDHTLGWTPAKPNSQRQPETSLATSDPSGQVILLNGTSSSGKSSIAKALLPILDKQSYHLARDNFNAARHQRQMPWEEFAVVLDRLVRGFHRAVAGMAATGNNLVVDHVIREQSWLRDFVSVAPDDLMLIKVYCPLSELRRRERARGDREVGIVDAQFDKTHRDIVYDFEVDTSTTDPGECAARIKEFVEQSRAPRAIDTLRSRLADGLLGSATG